MKYQVSFHAKTWYLHMWKYHRCYGYIIVLKKYFTRSLSSLVKYFLTLEEKFRIFARPCNILYIILILQSVEPASKKTAKNELTTKVQVMKSYKVS